MKDVLIPAGITPSSWIGTRRAIHRDEVARFGLMVERSAARVIERRGQLV